MDTKIIGSKIADARKETGLSQAQLAQQLFISPQAVGKWERGESIPDIITMNRLAEILAVDLNYFSQTAQPTTRGGVQKPSEAQNNVVQDIPSDTTDHSSKKNREELTSFNGSNLPGSDFAYVVAHKRKFNASALQGSDFHGADLTGSLFNTCNLREANFNGTNLTDCIISTSDLTSASFDKTIMVRTEINASENIGAKFSNIELTEVKLSKIDLRKAIFEGCIFNGTYFKQADLRGACFDSQIFDGVRFDRTSLDNASFKDAMLKNVSFRSTNAITNKYYRAIKTINFDGAKMDKLTIAALKGFGADLSNVLAI